jgi:hypothetical protein
MFFFSSFFRGVCSGVEQYLWPHERQSHSTRIFCCYCWSLTLCSRLIIIKYTVHNYIWCIATQLFCFIVQFVTYFMFINRANDFSFYQRIPLFNLHLKPTVRYMGTSQTSYNIDCALGPLCYIRACSIWIAWQRSFPRRESCGWGGQIVFLNFTSII